MKTIAATLFLLLSSPAFGDKEVSNTKNDPQLTTNLRGNEAEPVANDGLQLDTENTNNLFYISPEILTEIQEVPDSVFLSREPLGDLGVPSSTLVESDPIAAEEKEALIQSVFLETVGCTTDIKTTNFMCQTLSDDITMLCSSVVEGKTNYLLDANFAQTFDDLPTFIPLAEDVTIGKYAPSICEMACDGLGTAQCNSAMDLSDTGTGILGVQRIFENSEDVLSTVKGGEFNFESDPIWTTTYACQPYMYNLEYIPKGTTTLTKASLQDGVNFVCQPEASISEFNKQLQTDATIALPSDNEETLAETVLVPIEKEQYVMFIDVELH